MLVIMYLHDIDRRVEQADSVDRRAYTSSVVYKASILFETLYGCKYYLLFFLIP